jgi:hypothetical protein
MMACSLLRKSADPPSETTAKSARQQIRAMKSSKFLIFIPTPPAPPLLAVEYYFGMRDLLVQAVVVGCKR